MKQLTDNQATKVTALFIMGSSLVLTMANKAKSDSWISIILATFLSIPFIYVHIKIITLFPGKNFYQILDIVLGKFLGKFFCIVYSFFTFYLASLILRVYGDFIITISLDITPIIIPLIFMGILAIIAVKLGLNVIGRYSEFFFTFIVSLLLIIFATMFSQIKTNNILPIMYNGISPIILGTFDCMMFPCTQFIVIATCVTASSDKSPYKKYFKGYFYALLILLTLSTMNILIIGGKYSSILSFPAYITVMLTEIQNLGYGLEIILSTIFVLAGIIKISICLLSACKGISHFFNIKNYKDIVVPVGIISIIISYTTHDSVMEKTKFSLDVYPTYALPFQIILPIIILIFALIKSKKIKSRG